MAAGPGRDRHQPVGALFDRLAREPVVDHVMQGNPAPAMDRRVHILARAERGNHQRHLPLRTRREVRVEPVVRPVDDLVHPEWCGRAVRVIPVMRCQFLGDPVQPFIKLALRPRVNRRERPDHPRFALRDDQFRPRDNEHRRGDDRQAQPCDPGGKRGGQGHRQSPQPAAAFAALSTARTPAVATSSSMPTPHTVRPSAVTHSI